MTFLNVDDLLKQMDQDGAQARAILEKNNGSPPTVLMANEDNG